MKQPSLNNDDNFQIFLQGRNKKAKYLNIICHSFRRVRIKLN